MRDVMQGRTSFVIAHRLNTIRHCDVLLVIEMGMLKEMRWRTDELEPIGVEMLAQ